MKQFIAMLSVPLRGGLLTATVPVAGFFGAKAEALHRLRNDDPVWGSPAVELHWVHSANPNRTRCLPGRKICFKYHG